MMFICSCQNVWTSAKSVDSEFDEMPHIAQLPNTLLADRAVYIFANIRVRTDLEKSLNLTFVLEYSWNLKKCLLSWNFVKSSLKK